MDCIQLNIFKHGGVSLPDLVDGGRPGERSKGMPRTHTPYPEEYRQQILELSRAGRSAEDLVREFEPTVQCIRNRIKQDQAGARIFQKSAII